MKVVCGSDALLLLALILFNSETISAGADKSINSPDSANNHSSDVICGQYLDRQVAFSRHHHHHHHHHLIRPHTKIKI